MSGVNEIRSSFLDYFAAHGHEKVDSSPLVPRNDPTLMFTNAGMVQFKNVFTGVEKRPYSRAATSQKCVRAGGKHNDLDNVGYTARHHTFFEMLGNFSFGDYFKDEAITLAWNLITKEFALPKDRLLVTVYHDDDEAFGLWKKIAGFHDDRIIRIASSDNFWSMGDTGPCGPCSEIFFDQGPELQGGPPGSPDEDGDRFLEFWNLVFMQYEQVRPGERVPLPRPSIDTGMGLERIAAILQGVKSNFDIDLFRTLIRASSDLTGVPADGPQKASHRIIADHLRASAFLVADGVLPSNEGRGYVLRRIMRRAMRHAQLLGAKDPLMWRLVPALVREMGRAFPELLRAEALISETLRLEETRFRSTLARGLAILDEETRDLSAGGQLSGEVAFKLYDTFGFPLDLTQDALRARGIGVDTKVFGEAMERQRAEARKAWAGSGEAATETVWFAVKDRVGASEFLGYEAEQAEGVIAALVREGAETDVISQGQSGARGAQPDSLLRRVRRAGRRQRHPDGGGRARPCHRHAEEARRSLRASRRREGRRAARRHAGGARRRQRTPQRHPRQSFGDASAARGAAPGARRSRGAEGLDGRQRPPALRLRASQANQRGRTRARRRHRQPRHAAERARRHASHGGGRGDRVGRARAVRREIRRRGSRRVHGPSARRRARQSRVLDRIVRRHPCAAHRRHRSRHHRVGSGCRGGRSPHRGQDGRGRAPASERAGAQAARSGQRHQGARRRDRRARDARWSRIAASSKRSWAMRSASSP